MLCFFLCRLSGYSQEGIYPMNYYNHQLYGGQQYSPYMGPLPSGMFHGYYPFYPHKYNPAQSSYQAHTQTQHLVKQYPYLPREQFIPHPPPPPVLSLPTSLALSLSSSSSTISTSATKEPAESSNKDGLKEITSPSIKIDED
ncbi:unnamed protein product [Eruca vesicaria subsp. sativa]|uniref:Uncharacterized protein n=1 Tax=Eruca vesicaria subsp. sativa TaxID=29727 RepID=A0ABC8L8F0_ERUVS|nr:unnamed protein product [Eruca vesicaria subsp. sativa]